MSKMNRYRITISGEEPRFVRARGILEAAAALEQLFGESGVEGGSIMAIARKDFLAGHLGHGLEARPFSIASERHKYTPQNTYRPTEAAREIEELHRQRDELLEVCRAYVDLLGDNPYALTSAADEACFQRACQRARRTIAKATRQREESHA